MKKTFIVTLLLAAGSAVMAILTGTFVHDPVIRILLLAVFIVLAVGLAVVAVMAYVRLSQTSRR